MSYKVAALDSHEPPAQKHSRKNKANLENETPRATDTKNSITGALADHPKESLDSLSKGIALGVSYPVPNRSWFRKNFA
jgi:hypothetical protein